MEKNTSSATVFTFENCSTASGRGDDENRSRRIARARSSTIASTRVGAYTEGRWLRREKPFTGASARLAQYVAMLLPVSTHVQWMGLLPSRDLKILGARYSEQRRTHAHIEATAHTHAPAHLIDGLLVERAILLLQ